MMATAKQPKPTPYQRRLAQHLAAQDRRVAAERARLAAMTPEQRRAEVQQTIKDIWGE